MIEYIVRLERVRLLSRAVPLLRRLRATLRDGDRAALAEQIDHLEALLRCF